jgi:hypothetical protein
MSEVRPARACLWKADGRAVAAVQSSGWSLAIPSAVCDRKVASVRPQRRLALMISPNYNPANNLRGDVPTAGQFQLVPIDRIELDTSNPRIAYFLEHIPPPHTPQTIFLALGAGGDDDAGGQASFDRLRQSIQTNGGIVNPVILRQVEPERFVCVEGNTRVALYRELKEQGASGSWTHIPAVIHTSISDNEIHAIRLQAHLVGPRAWSAYAKAKYLTMLRNEEHFEFNRLVDFCGGNERSIREALYAFTDMEAHYRPQLSDEDFDQTRFSGFVELQKPAVKEAIAQAGFSLDDFARWIIDGKIDKLAQVRLLPRVLRDSKARAMFVKSGMDEALKLTDTPDLTKALQDAPLISLARALTEALRKVEHREVKTLRENPTSPAAEFLLEAHEALAEIISEINAD